MNQKLAAALPVIRLACAHELLGVLVKSGSERQIGRRALLLAYAIDPDLAGGTQRTLARRLGVTEARISQELKPIREHFRAVFPQSS